MTQRRKVMWCWISFQINGGFVSEDPFLRFTEAKLKYPNDRPCHGFRRHLGEKLLCFVKI